MLEKFVILQKKTDDHGLWSSHGLDKTHPHLYLGRNTAGHDVQIMSRVGNYKPGTVVILPGLILAGRIANIYFVDHTDPSPAPAAPSPVSMPKPLTAGEPVKDEIMVSIQGLTSKGKTLTEVAGSIFYVPSGATAKLGKPLREAMQDGAGIEVLTNVPYDTLDNFMTYFQRAFGFAGMSYVRPPGDFPGSKTITALHLVPGTSMESQRAILDALDKSSGP